MGIESHPNVMIRETKVISRDICPVWNGRGGSGTRLQRYPYTYYIEYYQLFGRVMAALRRYRRSYADTGGFETEHGFLIRFELVSTDSGCSRSKCRTSAGFGEKRRKSAIVYCFGLYRRHEGKLPRRIFGHRRLFYDRRAADLDQTRPAIGQLRPEDRFAVGFGPACNGAHDFVTIITNLAGRDVEICVQVGQGLMRDQFRGRFTGFCTKPRDVQRCLPPLFEPDIDLADIKPKPFPPREQAFRGEVLRIMLAALRTADKPISR